MKKSYFLLAAAIGLASCSSDIQLNTSTPGGTGDVINFQVNQKNVTRAQALNKAGHYNFGVFAYKSSDKVNNIMDNYLVGYYDEANAYSKAGSTWGDKEGQVDGTSYWMYEGLGSAEFTGTYAGQRLNAGEQFASNVENQYLKYWDKAAESTCFYAYAPYVNKVYTTKEVTYVDGQAKGTSDDTYVMTIPNGTLTDGYNDEAKYEFMYASTKVEKAYYGHDVALNFNRLNAKVNIKFWEDIPGYRVRIINVSDAYSVSAVPAIKDGTSGKYGYKLGKIYTENGAKIQFTDGVKTGMKQYEGTTASKILNFAAPTEAMIGESRIDASESATTYYAIPKGSDAAVLANGADKYTDAGTLNTDLKETGLTFHVSYELISDTGEKITVKDATVFVPTDYTNWVANTHYTYIFKITKGSNGTTDGTANPTDPEVPTEPALYPIVFDNCTVEDWKTSESEHIISDGTSLAYHNVTLDTYSVTTGAAADIVVTIADADKNLTHAVSFDDVAVTDPSGAAVATTVYTPGQNTIHVPADATAGVYTVTYTCPSADIYTNHPKTWTANFVVGNAYTVNTNLDEVGTNGLAATALSITAKKDGNTVTPTATELSIEYPVNVDATKVTVSADGKKVEVAQDATPGKYKLVYKVKYGVENGEVKEVVVAEKVFEVKDYGLVLSKSIVELDATAVNVVATSGIAGGVIACDKTTGVTITGMNLAIANTAAEGTYTVTYTVYGDASDANHVSTVQYQQTFEVKNTYTVALSKNTLNTTTGAANAAEYGTDYITITSKKNGVADAIDATTAGKYTIEGLTKDTDYKIFVDGTAIKLQVKKSVAAGNYTVVYTGQTTPDTKTAKAVFTVQN